MAWQLDDVLLPAMTMDCEAYIKQHVTGEMQSLTVAYLPLICRLAMQVQSVSGDVAELGVYKGGSALLLRRLFPGRRLLLFDTFAGNPTRGPNDNNHTGSFAATEDVVRRLFTDQQTYFFKGVFPETATAARLIDRRFAFVHLDCDQQQSVADGCEHFWPLVDGILLCDDYGSCKGAKLAWDAYFGRKYKCHYDNKRAWIDRREN